MSRLTIRFLVGIAIQGAAALALIASAAQTHAQRDVDAGSQSSTAPAAEADKKIYSGPQKGETLGAFPVWLVPVEEKTSEKVDLQELSTKAPLVIAVMHEKSRPAFQLARLMSLYGERLKDKKLQLYFVILTEDRSSSESWLRLVRKNFSQVTHLTVADGGIEGPGSVGLNRLAAMTIIVVKDAQVTANFALTQVSAEADGPGVLQAMSDVVDGGKAPSIRELTPAPQQMRRRP
ncbi:MAG: hypothetical protein KDB22_21705 [Planctomycetales bacterium]|nr:hypothetical protein [Planctomycetales bacterium]